MKCMAPIFVGKDNPDGGRMVPCGKCPACVANKASGWYVRLKEQIADSFNCVFVTLTYASDYLPDPRIDENCFINFDVSREDIRLYHYRLRKSLGEKSKLLKYFLVSEYGPNPDVDPGVGFAFERPHYHVIYFNLDKCDYDKITKAWNKGNVVFGDSVTEGRIRYVAGYCIEKCFTPPGRLPPFSCMSHGIGSGYVDKMLEWHAGDLQRVYIPNHGKPLPLPRYLREKLYSPAQNGAFAQICAESAERTYEKDLKRFNEDHVALARHYYEVRSNFIRKQREKHKHRKN